VHPLTARLVLVLALVSTAACGGTAIAERPVADVAAVPVTAVAAVERPLARFINVSGTLTAQEAANVAAEIVGRVVATPIERGSPVGTGGVLVRIAAEEVDAQAREAQANAAQIEARLGLADGSAFDVLRVPEVANAHAAQELASRDFERAQQLHAQRLLSQADFDQRRAQMDAAARQHDVARNTAEQQYQSLLGARARVTLAQKALADTIVRAPFAGVVGERFVAVGDYVTRGTKVATVMRVDPLRVELTVPEQYVAAVAAGRAVTFSVDAYPGQTFSGVVRYVSPSVKAETRALTVEAVVPNGEGQLKPGFFATARIEQASAQPGLMVPAAAVRTVAGTARVFVVTGDRVEERIVTTGGGADGQVEITSGLQAGERVAAGGIEQLVDGVRVVVR
jgi:membrane fusion protein, multidrug efflux system